MTRPLIGLTTYRQKNTYGYPITALMEKYIDAIHLTGGASVLIPSVDDNEDICTIIERVDGCLFTGGGDITGHNQNRNEFAALDDVDVLRDVTEFSLLKRIIELGKPFLGICRGIQLINVALGGTLYTHIPDQLPNAIKHNYDSGHERELLAHKVRVLGGTQLEDIVGESCLFVNSLHHQGVNVLAPGLMPAAVAPDGLVEALEMPGHPFAIGVQWHPEWLLDQTSTRRLLGAFINAART